MGIAKPILPVPAEKHIHTHIYVYKHLSIYIYIYTYSHLNCLPSITVAAGIFAVGEQILPESWGSCIYWSNVMVCKEF